MNETTQPAVAGPVEPTVRQHTPGPWRAVRDEVYAGKSRRVCPRVTAGESLPLGDDYERAKANARLIAAAPELFDVVQALLMTQQMRMDPREVLDENSPIMGAARDALRKVFGAA